MSEDPSKLDDQTRYDVFCDCLAGLGYSVKSRKQIMDSDEYVAFERLIRKLHNQVTR